jgi:hypothetical protein
MCMSSYVRLQITHCLCLGVYYFFRIHNNGTKMKSETRAETRGMSVICCNTVRSSASDEKNASPITHCNSLHTVYLQQVVYHINSTNAST